MLTEEMYNGNEPAGSGYEMLIGGFVIKDWDWHRFNFCPNCGGYNGFDGRPEWRPLIDVSSNDQK